MAIFYDWRDRTGKGLKPLREQIKELRSPVFIVIGILFLVLIVFSVLEYLASRQASTKSEKVYLLPDPPEQRTAMPETIAASAPSRPMSNIKSDDLNLSREVQEGGYAEAEDFFSSSSIPFAAEVETDDSMPSGTNQEDNAVPEPTIGQLEAEAAETEKLMAAGDMIQQQAIETMNQAIPMVVNHLNTLSSVEDSHFLAKTATSLIRIPSLNGGEENGIGRGLFYCRYHEDCYDLTTSCSIEKNKSDIHEGRNEVYKDQGPLHKSRL